MNPIYTYGTLALATALLGCQSTDGPASLTGKPASAAVAANQPADAKLLAINLVKAKSDARIVVTSTDFAPGDEIPYTFSDYGDRISPQLSFTGVPKEAKTLVLLMEDPDAQLPKPFIHWVLYNLPATTTNLRQAVPAEMQLVEFERTPQGLNSRGSIGYMGPRPPYKDKAHHYHFQVFALDTRLDVPVGTDRATVLNAMTGHVLAVGELVGTYKAEK